MKNDIIKNLVDALVQDVIHALLSTTVEGLGAARSNGATALAGAKASLPAVASPAPRAPSSRARPARARSARVTRPARPGGATAPHAGEITDPEQLLRVAPLPRQEAAPEAPPASARRPVAAAFVARANEQIARVSPGGVVLRRKRA